MEESIFKTKQKFNKKKIIKKIIKTKLFGFFHSSVYAYVVLALKVHVHVFMNTGTNK